MAASIVRHSTLSATGTPATHGNTDLNGYVAHVAKQLAKSGKLADMLNGGDELLRQVDPAARDALIRVAKAVRYALAQGAEGMMGKAPVLR